jgi:hypothetical protein
MLWVLLHCPELGVSVNPSQLEGLRWKEVPLIPELPPPDELIGAVAKPGYYWEFTGGEWEYIPRAPVAQTVTDMPAIPAVATRPQDVLSPADMPPIPDGFYLWEMPEGWNAADPWAWELPHTPPGRHIPAVAKLRAVASLFIDRTEILTGWLLLLASVPPVLGYIGWLYLRGDRGRN